MTLGGMILYVSFMNTGKGFQAILGFCLKNLSGFNAGTTDERDLWIIQFRWPQVAR